MRAREPVAHRAQLSRRRPAGGRRVGGAGAVGDDRHRRRGSAQQYPLSNGDKGIAVVPVQEVVVGDTRQTLFVLLAAVAFVLLIACANVANLLLARASARGRELVVRAAVGAGRLRLIRQMLTESVVLALLAGIGGVIIARWGVSALLALAPADLPRLGEVTVDVTALLFALGDLARGERDLRPRAGVACVARRSRRRIAAGRKGIGAGRARRLGAQGVCRHRDRARGRAGDGRGPARPQPDRARATSTWASRAIAWWCCSTVVPVVGPRQISRARSRPIARCSTELRAMPGVTAAGGVTSLPTAVRSNGGYWIQGGPGPEVLGMKSPQALFNVVTPDYFQHAAGADRARPRLQRRRSPRRAVCRDDQRAAREGRVSRRRSDRPHDPLRPRLARADDDRRHRQGHPHARAGAAGAGRDLHALRAASGPGDLAQHRDAHRRGRSAGARRHGGAADPQPQSRRAGARRDDGDDDGERDGDAAIPDGAAGGVRGGGAAAGDRRRLRRDGLHRQSARARDRTCAWRSAHRRRM